MVGLLHQRVEVVHSPAVLSVHRETPKLALKLQRGGERIEVVGK